MDDFVTLQGTWGRERGWVDISSETSCDKCWRDNVVEVAVYSHPYCPMLLCQDDAAEWERERVGRMAPTPPDRPISLPGGY